MKECHGMSMDGTLFFEVGSYGLQGGEGFAACPICIGAGGLAGRQRSRGPGQSSLVFRIHMQRKCLGQQPSHTST